MRIRLLLLFVLSCSLSFGQAKKPTPKKPVTKTTTTTNKQLLWAMLAGPEFRFNH
jgi:hypothetical protein